MEETQGYGPEHAIAMIAPVSLNMALTVALYHAVYRWLPPPPNLLNLYDAASSDLGGQWINATANALILVAFVGAVSFVLLLMFVFNCRRFIRFWTMAATAIVVFGVAAWFVGDLRDAYGLTCTRPTTAFLVGNYGVVGMRAIFSQRSLNLQRAIMIVNCSMTTMLYIRILPGYTVWCTLVGLAIWDAFAVLAPCGPLRQLADRARDADYSLGVGLIYECSDDVDGGGDGSNEDEGDEQSASEQEEDECMLRLGLGDFVFYSLLVAKVAETADVLTTLGCFIAVLVGLGVTLFSLSIGGRPLPALPLSITLGLIFYVGGRTFVTPFTQALGAKAIML